MVPTCSLHPSSLRRRRGVLRHSSPSHPPLSDKRLQSPPHSTSHPLEDTATAFSLTGPVTAPETYFKQLRRREHSCLLRRDPQGEKNQLRFTPPSAQEWKINCFNFIEMNVLCLAHAFQTVSRIYVFCRARGCFPLGTRSGPSVPSVSDSEY